MDIFEAVRALTVKSSKINGPGTSNVNNKRHIINGHNNQRRKVNTPTNNQQRKRDSLSVPARHHHRITQKHVLKHNNKNNDEYKRGRTNNKYYPNDTTLKRISDANKNGELVGLRKNISKRNNIKRKTSQKEAQGYNSSKRGSDISSKTANGELPSSLKGSVSKRNIGSNKLKSISKQSIDGPRIKTSDTKNSTPVRNKSGAQRNDGKNTAKRVNGNSPTKRSSMIRNRNKQETKPKNYDNNTGKRGSVITQNIVSNGNNADNKTQNQNSKNGTQKRTSMISKVSVVPGKSQGNNSVNPREISQKRRNELLMQRVKIIEKILGLIKKAEQKGVPKQKILSFLKKKGISRRKIIEAYTKYYKQEKLYEITFEERPLGFSVIMDTRGKNAIVSAIHDENNRKLGMKVASRIHEVNGKRVDGLRHHDILRIISKQAVPFYIVFKESRKNQQILKKIEDEAERALKWQDESDLNSNINDNNNDDDDGNESYSSDDDVAHVKHHFVRKKIYKKKIEPMTGAIKPNEVGFYDENDVQQEHKEMAKELSRLMMGMVVSQTERKNSLSAEGPKVLNNMTFKRRSTLKKLLSNNTQSSVENQTMNHQNCQPNQEIMNLLM